MYEERSKDPNAQKMITQLEQELQKTKSYYNKRIREIEDKYKYGGKK
jgi:hypothetical protein